MKTPGEEHRDYITDSLAGVLTLLIILGGLGLAVIWFYVFH